jgi:hypothetical protein
MIGVLKIVFILTRHVFVLFCFIKLQALSWEEDILEYITVTEYTVYIDLTSHQPWKFNTGQLGFT